MITGDQLKERLDNAGELIVAIPTLELIKSRLKEVGVTNLKQEPNNKASVKLTYDQKYKMDYTWHLVL